MAQLQANSGLVISLLDRLIDLDPAHPSVTEPERHPRVSDLKEAVRRDLEWLLNSKRMQVSLASNSAPLENSILRFGLPDFTNLTMSNSEHRRALCKAIIDAVQRFEPRLTDVRVSNVEGEQSERMLHFRIDGLLKVVPLAEPIAFDSVLSLASRDFQVQER